MLLGLSCLAVPVLAAVDLVRRRDPVEPVWSLPVLGLTVATWVGPVAVFALSTRTADDRDTVVLAYETLLSVLTAPVILAAAVSVAAVRWLTPQPHGQERPGLRAPSGATLVGGLVWLVGSVALALGLDRADALWGLPAVGIVALTAGVGETARGRAGREAALTWVITAQLVFLAGASLALPERLASTPWALRWPAAALAVLALGRAVGPLSVGLLALALPAWVVAGIGRSIGGPHPCPELPVLVDLDGAPARDPDRFFADVMYGNIPVIERRSADAGYGPPTDWMSPTYPSDQPYGLVHAHGDVAVSNLPIGAPLQLAGGYHVWEDVQNAGGPAVVIKQESEGAWVSSEGGVVPLHELGERLQRLQRDHAALLRGRCDWDFGDDGPEPYCLRLRPDDVPEELPDPAYDPFRYTGPPASAAWVVVAGPSPWPLQRALSVCLTAIHAGFEACQVQSIRRPELPAILLGPDASLLLTPEPPFADAVGLVGAQEP